MIRIVSAVIGLTLAALQSAVATEHTGAITGLVTDAVTQRPLANVRIVAADDNGVSLEAATDGSGRYRIDGLPEGNYQLSAAGAGYRTATEVNARVVGQRVAQIDFALRPQVTDRDEIVVVGKAVSADPFGGASAEIRTREEIRRAPGTGGDVFRGLDTLPAVAATGQFSNFSVRARDPGENLILIDNIPFDKVVHFESSLGERDLVAGGGRFSIFAPNLIDTAEFQPGGWSSAYGGKSASLLNLQLAEGNRSDPSFNIRVDLAGGEFTYDGPSYLLDDTSILFSARYFDFEHLFDLIGENDLGSPQLADFLFKSSTRLNAVNKISLIALFSPETFERDVKNALESDDFDDASLIDTSQESGLVGLTWERLFGDTGTATNTFYARLSDKLSREGESFPDLAGPDPDEEDVPVRPDLLHVDEEELEIGWRGDVSVATGLGLLTAGARVTHYDLEFARTVRRDFVRYVYDQNDFRPDPDQEFIVLTPARFNSMLDKSVTNFAVYLEHAFVLGDVTIRPGVRFDRSGLTDESLVSPRFSAAWQATATTQVTLTGGIFYQQPEFLELAADPRNVALDHEKSTQINLGLSQVLTEDLTLLAEIYYHDLDDLIVMRDATDGFAMNSGDGYTTGIDLALNKRLRDGWLGSIAYSFSEARRDDNFGDGSFDADFHRPHVFSASFSWQINDAWTLGSTWKYLSGRPTDSFIVNSNVLMDPMLLRFSKEIIRENDARVKDFHALNIRLDYQRRFGGVNLVAFLDVINVYGRNNVDRLQFNERLGTTVDSGLEVFPQLGLRFEF